jgi:hypothetical protein
MASSKLETNKFFFRQKASEIIIIYRILLIIYYLNELKVNMVYSIIHFEILF